ncbi:MAG: tRNA (adenine-N1)-methyltransferase [Chloroflexi bacterium]|nr:tRNA (adenine-N1)-methyltransferase [Chloroflexota bacterium]
MAAESRVFQEGDAVLVVDNEDHRFLMFLGRGRSFQSHQGALRHEEIMGRGEGEVLSTNKGFPLVVLRPSLSEYIMTMRRRTQIIYPKDVALILVMADLYPGLTVVEAGLGSGSLALGVLRALAGTGRLVSYETRPEFREQAERNLRGLLGETPNHTIKDQDIYQGIAEREVDRVLLDLPEPWRLLPAVAEALAPGGILMCYLPTVLQIHHTVEEVRRDGRFTMIEVVESLVRPWHVAGPSVRPEHRMVAHTGFLIFARRFVGLPPAVDEAPAAADRS